MINLLPGVNNTSAALEAERIRMEVISQNIANANTTRGLDGRPYQRQMVVFENVLKNQMASGSGVNPNGQMVSASRIIKDTTPGRQIYNPGSPDADKNGLVTMPNINVNEEMVDMIASSRTFEANLAVVKNARSMAMQSLSIGKH